MAYSKAYQEVVAGRVREDEAIGFFRDNDVASPARVFNLRNVGATKQPALTTDALQHTGVGKAGTTSDNISAYKPDTFNIA